MQLLLKNAKNKQQTKAFECMEISLFFIPRFSLTVKKQNSSHTICY